jgi:hypothetical protein
MRNLLHPKPLGFIDRTMKTNLSKFNNAEIAVIVKRLSFEIGCTTDAAKKEELTARRAPFVAVAAKRKIAMEAY